MPEFSEFLVSSLSKLIITGDFNIGLRMDYGYSELSISRDPGLDLTQRLSFQNHDDTDHALDLLITRPHRCSAATKISVSESEDIV